MGPKTVVVYDVLVNAAKNGLHGCMMVNETQARIYNMMDILHEAGYQTSATDNKVYRYIRALREKGMLRAEEEYLPFNETMWTLEIRDDVLEELQKSKASGVVNNSSPRTAIARPEVREVLNAVFTLQEDVQRLAQLLDTRLITLEERLLRAIEQHAAVTTDNVTPVPNVAEVAEVASLPHVENGHVVQLSRPAVNFLFSLLDGGEVYMSSGSFGKRFLEHFEMNGGVAAASAAPTS